MTKLSQITAALLLKYTNSKLIAHCRELNVRAGHVVGLNLLEEMQLELGEMYPNANFQYLNITNSQELHTDIPNESSDFMIANFSLIDHETVRNAFTEIRRILKSTGLVVFVVLPPTAKLAFIAKNMTNNDVITDLRAENFIAYTAINEPLLTIEDINTSLECKIFFAGKTETPELLYIKSRYKEYQHDVDAMGAEKSQIIIENAVDSEQEAGREKKKREEDEVAELDETEAVELNEQDENAEIEPSEKAEIEASEPIESKAEEIETEWREPANVNELETEEDEPEAIESGKAEAPESELEKSELIEIEPKEIEIVEHELDASEGKQENEELIETETHETTENGTEKLEPTEEDLELETAEPKNREARETEQIEHKASEHNEEITENALKPEAQDETEENAIKANHGVHEPIETLTESNKTAPEKLATLAKQLEQSQTKLEDHRTKISAHLDSSALLLKQLMNPALLPKNEDHQTLLNTYRSLYKDHQALLDTFLEAQKNALTAYPKLSDSYHEIVLHHKAVLAEHHDEIEEHEEYLLRPEP